MRLEKGEVEIGSRIQMLNSTHTLVSPTPTALEGYLLEFESSMSVSFVSEYSRYSSRYLSIFVCLRYMCVTFFLENCVSYSLQTWHTYGKWVVGSSD